MPVWSRHLIRSVTPRGDDTQQARLAAAAAPPLWHGGRATPRNSNMHAVQHVAVLAASSLASVRPRPMHVAASTISSLSSSFFLSLSISTSSTKRDRENAGPF
jgi:hypothetical protein